MIVNKHKENIKKMKYCCIRCDCEHELKLKEVLGKQRISCPDCGFELIKVENRALEKPLTC